MSLPAVEQGIGHGVSSSGIGSGISQARPAREQTTRMFETDFLERLSRIHPATPFVVWLPVIATFVVRSYLRHDVGIVSLVALFVAGVFAWTLAEYLLHKYIFHWVGRSARARRFHFLAHGVHHEYPNDKDRLVMPLPTSVPLSFVFYALYIGLMGRAVGEPFFAGFVLGYLGYDGTHYALHHFRPRSRVGKYFRRHHMLHHHADNEGGFGVSSPLWDVIFRTMPKAKRAPKA